MLKIIARRQTVLASLRLAVLLLTLAALSAAIDWRSADAEEERRAVAITAGAEHACALLDSGEIECWGDDSNGQTHIPASRFRAIDAGGWHTCALRETGAIECWERNDYGLADTPAGRFSAVSAGGWHGCGLRETGKIEC